ncbi:MAG: radical SAM protein, partial [Desulfobacterales bacterium]
MGWHISPAIADILEKGGGFSGISRDEALTLLHLPPQAREVYALMETANRMSRQQFGDKGENHFHIGVNLTPCPLDCKFCSLSARAGIFTEAVEFEELQIVAWARQAEAQNADGLNIMTTGTFSFQRLLEIGRLLKKTVTVPLVANTRDVSHKEGEALLDAGFVGAYHAVRLGEGRDTPLNPEKRIHTIQVFRDVGLRWMNCVEPVGP